MMVATTHALLKQRGMMTIFWGEAVMTAVHIFNCSPTKALDGEMPYEAWHGFKPAVSYLCIFDYLTFINDSTMPISSTTRAPLGYSPGTPME